MNGAWGAFFPTCMATGLKADSAAEMPWEANSFGMPTLAIRCQIILSLEADDKKIGCDSSWKLPLKN